MKKIITVTPFLFLFTLITQAQDTLTPSHTETIDFIEESISDTISLYILV